MSETKSSTEKAWDAVAAMRGLCPECSGEMSMPQVWPLLWECQECDAEVPDTWEGLKHLDEAKFEQWQEENPW